MPKYKKKQILSFLSALEQTNDIIKRQAENDSEKPLELLARCQNLALEIGEDLELYGETAKPLVAVLEEYCETLYQQSLSLANREKRLKHCKRIQKLLIKIREGSMKLLPEDKKEAVFLPYKASMWDSLESIWRAAAESQDYDVYVVPIPYFDKNPDGSLGQMHYEGGEYPGYVPVTSWQEYDLEKRKPDMVFIHNPYDNCNYVTSVHPFFYAAELKKHTEKLVYVPYFVLEEPDPENPEAAETVDKFCFFPGVIFADKVIVQSENMRRLYIREFMKAAKEQGFTVEEKTVREKIQGWGSPKFDKVAAAAEEPPELPENWRRLIEKPGGGRKKVVLYNTSITALLAHNEEMLEKMEAVLQTFKDYRQEIALWWRPHPLITSTIKAMRPQLWERYGKLVETYKSQGWGIYDDTAQLERAISASDAYYGDPSSLVQMYEAAGKPVKLQAFEN